MKTFRYILPMLALALVAGCKEQTYDDISFLQTAKAPANSAAVLDITNDNSGLVTITPSGEGASSFEISFGDTTKAPAAVALGKGITHRYAEGNYSIKVVAKGLTGLSSEKTIPLSLVYRAPENLAVTTTNAAHKLTISAKADYAASFLVYYGDVPNEVGTPLAKGASATHEYAKAGTYDIKVVALSGGKAQSEKITPLKIYDAYQVPIDFESATVNYFFGGFGGTDFAMVDNPNIGGINTSKKVGKLIKRRDQVWGGLYSPLDLPLDFSAGKIIKMKVFSNRIGAKITLQLEQSGLTNLGNTPIEVATTKANEWEELTFDFSAYSSDAKWKQIVLFLDNGTLGVNGSPDWTILFDDIKQSK